MTDGRLRLHAEAIADNLENGNLTDAIDALFEHEGVDLAILTTLLIEQITLVRVLSVTDVSNYLVRLIRTWENHHAPQ